MTENWAFQITVVFRHEKAMTTTQMTRKRKNTEKVTQSFSTAFVCLQSFYKLLFTLPCLLVFGSMLMYMHNKVLAVVLELLSTARLWVRCANHLAMRCLKALKVTATNRSLVHVQHPGYSSYRVTDTCKSSFRIFFSLPTIPVVLHLPRPDHVVWHPGQFLSSCEHHLWVMAHILQPQDQIL